jgi:PAS domain S-box-containing protein/putative nucleotidyltransferase with HDIG domain
MLWQWSPSVIAELAASAILLVLAIYFPWRDLNRQARLTGVTLVFFCALWILSHAFEIGLPVVSYKESLAGLQLVLGMMALTFWLFYILHYLGPRKLFTRRIYILSGIMPLIAILALSTNNIHGLMWTGPGLDSQNPYLPLEPTYGIIYWACMVYVAMLTLTGSFLIIWNIIRRRYGYSRKSIYLLVAAILPLIVAFIEVTGLTSFLKTPVGLTPWAACIGAIILILNLPQLRAEQVIPIARDIVFERIGDCILVLDMQNRVLDLNPAAEQLIGYRISDAFGLSIERLWPYQSSPIRLFNKMVKGGEELVLERDGKQRVYDQRISTISDAGGRLTSQVVLLTDITERKQAEESLRASEEKYRALVENINDVLYTLDTHGNITYISPSVERLSKYKVSDLIEKPFTPIIYPDDLPGLLDSFYRLISGQPESWEFRLVDKDGGIIFVRTSSRPIYEDGQIVSITGMMSDITERKQAAKELIIANKELVFQNEEKEKRAKELIIANKELVFQNEEKEKRAKELIIANKELVFQNEEKEKRAKELSTAEGKLKESYESLKKTLNDAIDTMAKIVETRDPYTAGHQQKVADLATAIAREMKLEDTRIDQLRMAATIHDIGKMYVPSDILSKPGKLSDMEFNLIKAHPQYGYDIVKGMDFPCNIAKTVLQHHERLDGSGYPNQLKGEDMILEAKILAVADVVEAMVAHRPYRPALGLDKALEEISKNTGKLYDPDVVDACLELFGVSKFVFKSV